MTLNNRLAILLTALVAILFIVTKAIAAECEDTYYYVSLDYEKDYKAERVRSFQLAVGNAFIYDVIFLPSSWVYDITCYKGSCRETSVITATAKSDKHTLKVKDFNKFVIIRQPNNKSEQTIFITLSIIYMTKEGGVNTYDAGRDPIKYNDFTLQKIDKCLTRDSRIHY
ncbi:hypothetical protein [Candidatus Magnetominusculus xianensis]|uniref:Secreted protein n=1 Tax=Candidatus Magnetominusculus xianensis TaxID=1748249 RepID=A0ABR5SH39_9BACT|nr:hypothetical protein [Candidatus Magnetominusculus xianensis]KWT91016.1 hypothetical protein ASN18_0963 [Candidatus Magnetominusculus xianensis]MBF0402591.1 hypothetical protein [Nitrospirota bacterium]